MNGMNWGKNEMNWHGQKNGRKAGQKKGKKNWPKKARKMLGQMPQYVKCLEARGHKNGH
jgi:hypothetical protein